MIYSSAIGQRAQRRHRSPSASSACFRAVAASIISGDIAVSLPGNRSSTARRPATSFWHRLVPLASRMKSSSANASSVSAADDNAGVTGNPLRLARLDSAALFSPPGGGLTIGQRPTRAIHNVTCHVRNISRRCHGVRIDSRNCSVVRGIIFVKQNRSGIAVP